MEKYIIKPYEGVLPITFGMSVESIEALLGKPLTTERDEFGSLFSYPAFNIMFSGDDKVEEVGFNVGVKSVDFNGDCIFGVCSNTNPLEYLKSHDANPVTTEGGAIVFVKLGISLTGYPDGTHASKALTCFARGVWDDLLNG